eukprot:TRINITY_DN3883_c2_g1_i3.p2 TRINITY_DN3883_c2_g1~~TRINITY_DN3883_c2_g1_i3.p2  ORF type:complete len:265 (-),score=-2.73 TRINITY_DN3883_c2_g1_i3:66-860(-)
MKKAMQQEKKKIQKKTKQIILLHHHLTRYQIKHNTIQTQTKKNNPIPINKLPRYQKNVCIPHIPGEGGGVQTFMTGAGQQLYYIRAIPHTKTTMPYNIKQFCILRFAYFLLSYHFKGGYGLKTFPVKCTQTQLVQTLPMAKQTLQNLVSCQSKMNIQIQYKFQVCGAKARLSTVHAPYVPTQSSTYVQNVQIYIQKNKLLNSIFTKCTKECLKIFRQQLQHFMYNMLQEMCQMYIMSRTIRPKAENYSTVTNQLNIFSQKNIIN